MKPKSESTLPRKGNAFSRFVGDTVLSLLGWEIEGELPNIPKFVAIAAPHTSNWDFIIGMAVLLSLGVSVNWLGKHTIFRWPVRSLFHWLGGIPVDRETHHGTVEQIVDLFNSRSQMIFGLSPEGTRKRIDKWKTGFYQIALQAKIPILLVSLDYSKKKFGIGPVVIPSGEFKKDLDQIGSHYRQIKAKYPENFSVP